MPKVLFIAYFFPPSGGAGVQRTVKFIKYLPQFHWQPVLLTARQETRLRDHTLAEDIPQDLPIYRTRNITLPSWLPWRLRNWVSRWILIVDEQLGWLPFAVRAGKKIIQQEQIRLIYSTSTPYTDHLVGYRLKSITGLPWVADFRDPWINNVQNLFPTRFHRFIGKQLEAAVVKSADRILVVSEPMKIDLLSRYPTIESKNIHVIPNGYDRQDFDGLHPASANPDKMLILYNGSFYTDFLTPLEFFQAVQSTTQAGLIPKDRIAVRVIGNTPRFVDQWIEEMRLAPLVETLGYLPHKSSLEHLLAADVLLLIIGDRPGSEAIYTGKIFEYLAVHRPILALVPPGVASDLVRRANAGLVVHPEDIPGISTALVELYQRWERGELHFEMDTALIEEFDRQTLTRRLAGIFNTLDKTEVGVLHS